MNDQVVKDDLLNIMLLNHSILKPFEAKTISGLTMLQFRTLCILRCEGELSLNKLAQFQNITKQQQSIIIKGLVDDGYVSRETDAKDRRIIHFKITKKGNDLMNQQLSQVADSMILRLKCLDEEKRNKAFEAIHYINTILNEIV